ncbi:MAG: rhomboid family intramembrane serine protease [Rhodobacteraceae bacterium]|nr:rhomboid family intramembrane serine protease [Paracoccaceae bacterium]
MFPIRDHNPSARTPVVTYALIAANILVYLALLPRYGDPRALSVLLDGYALIPARIAAGRDAWTLVSSMFLHAGLLHLAGNMLFLHVFGDNLEDQLGHLGFLAFYLAVGIGAGIVQVAAAPLSPVPVVGASGAIAGVMGGYLLMFPRARIDLLLFLVVFIRIFTVRAWLLLVVWFAMQLAGGAATPADAGGVAYWAHSGGFVLGAALMLPVWIARGGPGFWSRTAGRPAHPEARYRFVRSPVPDVARRPRRPSDIPIVPRRRR